MDLNSAAAASRLAWSLWAGSITLIALGLVFGLLPRSTETGGRVGLTGVPLLLALVALSTVSVINIKNKSHSVTADD